jgi:molybdopterin converting factor small subunit
MAAKVQIPSLLQKLVGGAKEIETSGATIGQVVDDLESRNPGIKARLLEEDTGNIQPFVTIYLNDEDVRFLEGLDTLVADDDTILILPAVAGG